ncbi:hypothetical protein CN507_17860 [Bacillus cereus]|nr:hypothetical protein CN507_17860 [Bacillus cereus]
MNLKSAKIVLLLGGIFIFSGLIRLIDLPIPAIVIALMSVMAACLSLSDLFETININIFAIITNILASLSFVALMIVWLFFRDLNFSFIPRIGDGFTVIGLGLVIGSFGLKEILEHQSKGNLKVQNEMIAKCHFEVTSNEYDEMETLGDIIEKLKGIDEYGDSLDCLHNGWFALNNELHGKWPHGQCPFFDGANRNKFDEFSRELDNVISLIQELANPNSFSGITREIDIYGTSMEVRFEYRLKAMPIPTVEDLEYAKKKMFTKWDELEEMIRNRYKKERLL